MSYYIAFIDKRLEQTSYRASRATRFQSFFEAYNWYKKAKQSKDYDILHKAVKVSK